jgi:hypothetical protein
LWELRKAKPTEIARKFPAIETIPQPWGSSSLHQDMAL